jgi:hypothetical protein
VWVDALKLLQKAGRPVLNNLALKYKLGVNMGDLDVAESHLLKLQISGYKDPRFLHSEALQY